MRKKPNPESLPNIRRIDAKPGKGRNTHGFQVHFARGDKEWTKLFSDSVYGSKRAARDAAILYRGALRKDIPRSCYELGFIPTAKHSNTGYLGVSFTFSSRKTIENQRCFSVSVHPQSGKLINRKFPIAPGKYEETLKEAVAWRDRVLRERRMDLDAYYKSL